MNELDIEGHFNYFDIFNHESIFGQLNVKKLRTNQLLNNLLSTIKLAKYNQVQMDY